MRCPVCDFYCTDNLVFCPQCDSKLPHKKNPVTVEEKKSNIIIGVLAVIILIVAVVWVHNFIVNRQPAGNIVGSASDDYILPLADSYYYTEEDLAGLTKEELAIARNELYARHGYIFSVDGKWQKYFEEKSWYDPMIPTKQFKEEERFNRYEMKNLTTILKMEQSISSSDQSSHSIQPTTETTAGTEDPYLSINSTGDFTIRNTDTGLSFAIPNGIYDYNRDYSLSNGMAYYYGSSTDGSEVLYTIEDNTYSSNQEAYDAFDQKMNREMIVKDEIITNREGGRLIQAGLNSDGSLAYYYLVSITDNEIYTMKITYPDDEVENVKVIHLHHAYVVDCLYRYFNKSGNTRSLFHTYEEFVDSGAY